MCDPHDIHGLEVSVLTVGTHSTIVRARTSSSIVVEHILVAWFSYLLIPMLCFVPFTLSFQLCVIRVYIYMYINCTYISSFKSSTRCSSAKEARL